MDNSEHGETTAVLKGDQETLRKELQKAKEQEACFIVIRGSPQGHRFFITAPEMTIGRDAAADISLVDQSISRKHAKIIKNGTKVSIMDLNSSNGTYINDKRVAPGETVVLAKEDMVKLGSLILKFLPAGEIEIIVYGILGDAANQDPMTRIYNKGYLLDALESEFKRAKALHADFSIIFFDLDHFKKINDNYGHDAGDYVLKELANLVQTNHLRPKDVFARYGGEEFVILLMNTNIEGATLLAERIRASVQANAFMYDGKRLPVTTSVGVAELRSDIEAAQTLLKLADKALYEAKFSGRNKVVAASN